MTAKWIKKDDTVLIIAGNDKGKMGTVLARKADRILVQGINVRKKHLKRKDENSKADIIDIELPVHISNVALCTKEGTKIKLSVNEKKTGERELVYKENGKNVVHRTLKTNRKGK